MIVLILLIAVVIIAVLLMMLLWQPSSTVSYGSKMSHDQSDIDEIVDDSDEPVVGSGGPMVYLCIDQTTYDREMTTLTSCLKSDTTESGRDSCMEDFLLNTGIDRLDFPVRTSATLCEITSAQDPTMCLSVLQSTYDAAHTAFKSDGSTRGYVTYGNALGAFNPSSWKSKSSLCK